MKDCKSIFTKQTFLEIVKYILKVTRSIFLCYITIIAIRESKLIRQLSISELLRLTTHMFVVINITMIILMLIIKFITHDSYTHLKKLYIYPFDALQGILVLSLFLPGEMHNDAFILTIICALIRFAEVIINEIQNREEKSMGNLHYQLVYYFLYNKTHSKIQYQKLTLENFPRYNVFMKVEENVEELTNKEYIEVYISGYIVHSYFFNNKKEYSINEIRSVLIKESSVNIVNLTSYKRKSLLEDYFNDDLLNEAIQNVIKLIEKNKEEFFIIERKTRTQRRILHIS